MQVVVDHSKVSREHIIKQYYRNASIYQDEEVLRAESWIKDFLDRDEKQQLLPDTDCKLREVDDDKSRRSERLKRAMNSIRIGNLVDKEKAEESKLYESSH